MPLPPKLTKFTTASQSLVNVDFTSFATGTGIVVFYAGDVNSTAGGFTPGEYVLSSEPFFSDKGSTFMGNNVAGDVDFDVVFNRRIEIEGLCIVQVPIQQSTLGAGSFDTTITARIRHWDGSTETTLVSGTSLQNMGLPGGNVNDAKVGTIRMTIPRKIFKRGETLRLTIETSAGGAVNRSVWIAHDPMSRLDVRSAEDTTTVDGGTVWDNSGTSALTVQIPIVVP